MWQVSAVQWLQAETPDVFSESFGTVDWCTLGKGEVAVNLSRHQVSNILGDGLAAQTRSYLGVLHCAREFLQQQFHAKGGEQA